MDFLLYFILHSFLRHRFFAALIFILATEVFQEKKVTTAGEGAKRPEAVARERSRISGKAKRQRRFNSKRSPLRERERSGWGPC